MGMIRFRFKLTAVFIIFALFVLAPTVYLIYEVTLDRQTKELRERILGIVKLSSVNLDTNKISQIKPESASESTVLYGQVRNYLRELRNTDSLIDSVYIMVKSDKQDTLLFLVDSGDRRKISASCGEEYNISGIEEMKEAFNGPSVDKKPTADKWGIFLSGYAPLRDSQGKPIAIIGVDVRAESIQMMQVSLAKRFGIILILGIMFSLALGWFIARNLTNPLKILTLGVKEIGRGNLDNKVEIKTKDELQELANAFNKMSADLKSSRLKLEKYYLDTIHSLARIIEAKDPYTKGHSERVAAYAVGVAKYMHLPEKDICLLQEVAILHDIGKIGVNEDILTKSDALTQEEWETVKTHPEVGEDILKFFEFLQPGLSVIRDHHERPDGRGYPRGLVANQISKLALIVAVADSFDAMTSDRSYRKAFSCAEAIVRLKEGRGKQFDPEVVDIFILFLKENHLI